MSAIAIGFLVPGITFGSTGEQLLPVYELELKFDPEKKQCSGRAFIHLPDSAVEDGKVGFEIAYGETGIRVRKVTDDTGRELKFSVWDNNSRLDVELGGRREIVAVEYSFPVDETALKPYGYYRFSGSPLYPVLLRAGGRAFRFSDFDVSFEYPATLSVLTTGGEGEPRDHGAWTSAIYGVKHAPGFAIVAGEGFVVDCREEGGVPVVAFYQPEFEGKFSTVIERTVEAAAWYRQTYGFFPLEQIGIIQGHPTWGGGLSFTRYFTALVANHNQTIGLPRQEAKELNFDYNSLIRHGKAAVGVYLQSLLIGRERFLDLQRQILEEYRHRPLPESEYISILIEYGSEDAETFYRAWKRGDATIGVSVKDVSPNENNNGWTVELVRTGPVPYPVEVEAISGDGGSVRHVVEAGARIDEFDVGFTPVDIRIDPRGLIPMASSSHPDVQIGYALAHERNGLDEPFFAMAGALLDENPDNDYLRYRLARRLYQLARWEQCAALWKPDRGNGGRYAVLVALYSTRALSKLGRQAEALGRLEGLNEPAGQIGLLDFWEKVKNEADN
jgi:hypothetical protein